MKRNYERAKLGGDSKDGSESDVDCYGISIELQSREWFRGAEKAFKKAPSRCLENGFQPQIKAIYK